MSSPPSPVTHGSDIFYSLHPWLDCRNPPTDHPAHSNNWRQKDPAEPRRLSMQDRNLPLRHYVVNDPDLTKPGCPFPYVEEVQDYLVPGHKDEPGKTKWRGWNPVWADDREYDEHGVHRSEMVYTNSGHHVFTTRYRDTGVVEVRWVPPKAYAEEVARGFHPPAALVCGGVQQETPILEMQFQEGCEQEREHEQEREEEHHGKQITASTRAADEAQARSPASPAPPPATHEQQQENEEDSDSGWLQVSNKRRRNGNRRGTPVRR